MLKEKMKQKETEQKQKNEVFCLVFLFFLKRKEKRLKTISKIMERPSGFFPQVFLTPRDQKQKIEFSNVFSKKATTIF